MFYLNSVQKSNNCLHANTSIQAMSAITPPPPTTTPSAKNKIELSRRCENGNSHPSGKCEVYSEWQLMTYSNTHAYHVRIYASFFFFCAIRCIYINFRANLLFKVLPQSRFAHAPFFPRSVHTLFGVWRYNISNNQVNSYLNIMRFNWCIMVFILLLVKANQILVRLTSIRFDSFRFVSHCEWRTTTCL